MVIVFGLILIAAFAVVAILIDPVDQRQDPFDPRNGPPLLGGARPALGRQPTSPRPDDAVASGRGFPPAGAPRGR